MQSSRSLPSSNIDSASEQIRVLRQECQQWRDKCHDLERRVKLLETENARLLLERNEALLKFEQLSRSTKRPHAPFSKGPPKSHPKRPGRKKGKAYGKKAHRAVPEKIDEVLEATLPEKCPHCGGSSFERLPTVEQYQVELPREPWIRKFVIEVGRCKNCEHRVQGHHALQTSDAIGAAKSQLGPEAQTTVVFLNKVLGLSYGKISMYFRHAFGIELSRGAGAQIVHRAALRSKEQYLKMLGALKSSKSIHIDETGWKVGGWLYWLWVFTNNQFTVYGIKPSRGSDVVSEMLGSDYTGALTHDGWSAYDSFKKATHQQCNQHILRRCHEIVENARGPQRRFATAVKALFQDGISIQKRLKSGEITGHGARTLKGRLEARMSTLLKSQSRYPPNRRLAKHLRKHLGEWFNYLKYNDLETTNNTAERQIRPAVVNRKIWGGSKTDEGAEVQAALTSILQTCQQQKRNPLEFFSRIFRGQKPRLKLNNQNLYLRR